MSVCNILFADLRRFPFDVFGESMQRLYASLHGTLGSNLRDAMQEGNTDVVAPIPRA
jgi:hypothetical protein